MDIFTASLNSAIETLQDSKAGNTSEAIAPTPAIGTPVYNPYSHDVGYIAEVKPCETRSFMIGAKMQPITAEYVIVYDRDGNGEHWTASQSSNVQADEWVAEAARMGIEPALNAPDLLRLARAADNAEREKREQERQAAKAARDAYEREIAPKIPAWAAAVIIAEYREDRCDSMTDYFNSETTRTVILGFSKHTRNLFPELRKAALNFPDTADLFDAPASAEHRENYSMGGGMYLAHGWRHRTGWKIKKRALGDDRARSIPSGDWFVTAPAANPSPTQTAGTVSGPMAGGWTISQHVHTKKGFDMWICSLETRVERATFDHLRDRARDLGGWYSRPWGKTPGGFAFKSEAQALEFVGAGQPVEPGNGGGVSEATERQAMPERSPAAAPAHISEAIGAGSGPCHPQGNRNRS